MNLNGVEEKNEELGFSRYIAFDGEDGIENYTVI